MQGISDMTFHSAESEYKEEECLAFDWPAPSLFFHLGDEPRSILLDYRSQDSAVVFLSTWISCKL